MHTNAALQTIKFNIFFSTVPNQGSITTRRGTSASRTQRNRGLPASLPAWLHLHHFSGKHNILATAAAAAAAARVGCERSEAVTFAAGVRCHARSAFKTLFA